MKPAAVVAVFADVKPVKTRSVVQLVFEVPVEQADMAMKALGGFPRPGETRWAAIASMMTESAEKESKKRTWNQLSPAARSAILCNDKEFQQFCENRAPVGSRLWEAADEQRRRELTIIHIYTTCGINSRAQLNENAEAAEKFAQLETEFMAAAGRIPSPR